MNRKSCWRIYVAGVFLQLVSRLEMLYTRPWVTYKFKDQSALPFVSYHTQINIISPYESAENRQ